MAKGNKHKGPKGKKHKGPKGATSASPTSSSHDTGTGRGGDGWSKKKERRKGRRKGPHSHHMDDDDRLLYEQLKGQNLRIREIVGDGNCMFRAISDQLFGNETHHRAIRQSVIDYMTVNQADFQPFVPEDQPYDKYLAILKKPGEYGDNACLVAFCRQAQVDVFVHQLNQPVWIIRCDSSAANTQQVHLAYHEYEHYSSVRQVSHDSLHIATDQLQAKQEGKERGNVGNVGNVGNDGEDAKGGNVAQTSSSSAASERRARLKAKVQLLKRSEATADRCSDDGSSISTDKHEGNLSEQDRTPTPASEESGRRSAAKEAQSNVATTKSQPTTDSTSKARVSAKERKRLKKAARKERRDIERQKAAAQFLEAVKQGHVRGAKANGSDESLDGSAAEKQFAALAI